MKQKVETSLTSAFFKDSNRAVHLFRAIANNNRLQILALLVQRPHYVNELTKKLDISQTMTSQHLAVLRKARVVSTKTRGKEILYALVDHRVENILKALSIEQEPK